jgi:hypothetical protein
MKKLFLITTLLIVFPNINLKAQNNFQIKDHDKFQQFNDSILSLIKQTILEDLTNKGLFVIEGSQNWIGVTYSLSLKLKNKRQTKDIVLSELKAYTSNRKHNSMQQKLHNTYFRNIKNHIIKNNEFPYEWIECINYKFITEIKDSKKAIYGQYSFTTESLTLIKTDSKIEFLDDTNAIIHKIYTEW